MIAGFGKVTTLSDMSANMFAAFLLILIMELSAASQRKPLHEPDRRSVAPRNLQLVSRKPLSPPALVQFLYDRRPNAAGWSLDLFATRVVVSARGGDETLREPATAAANVRAEANSLAGPVRLYVFANDLYNPVIAALDEKGVPHQEQSVPIALRDSGLDGWSASFTHLSRTAGSLPEFREGLARILNGGVRSASGAAAARLEDFSPFPGLAKRLSRIFREVLVGSSIAAAVLSVLWIEVRTRRGP